ncbi:MAG: hypothetical protein ACJAXU_002174 [Paracoccaceae bacterium]|jgi:hypothetical protein
MRYNNELNQSGEIFGTVTGFQIVILTCPVCPLDIEPHTKKAREFNPGPFSQFTRPF